LIGSAKRRSVVNDLIHKTESFKDPKVIIKETEMPMFAEEPPMAESTPKNQVLPSCSASKRDQESRNLKSQEEIQ